MDTSSSDDGITPQLEQFANAAARRRSEKALLMYLTGLPIR